MHLLGSLCCCCSQIFKDQLLVQVLAILSQQLHAAAASGGEGGGAEWRGIEAAYHCMGSLKDERLPRADPQVIEVCVLSFLCCCRQHCDRVSYLNIDTEQNVLWSTLS